MNKGTPVTTILHLSDLHLDAELGPTTQRERALFAALRAARPWELSLVVVTGDILDSAAVEEESAVRAVRTWCQALLDALGVEVPLILIPGNHDRRNAGVFGPQRAQIFRALKEGLAGRGIWVSGCALPQLAEKMPSGLTGELPFDLCAYDSTFLGMGKMSAGGTLRAEDLLQLASWLHPAVPGSETPLVLLMHHHLIPTPVTDTTAAGSAGAAPYLQILLHSVAPRLIAHADREELFMTALGAGSALSLLHAMRRPVVVLHGHKHCPSVRLLRSPEQGSGDVLLLGAGSAGLAERWSTEGADEDRPMKLWPSYNLISYRAGVLDVKAVAFDPKVEMPPQHSVTTVSRPLVHAQQSGTQWQLTPLPERTADLRGPRWAVTRARYTLQAASGAPERWDLECEQEVIPEPGHPSPKSYREPILVRPGATLERMDGAQGSWIALPGQVRWRSLRGLCRTAHEARRVIGPEEAFGHIELINRHTSRLAELSLAVPDGIELAPFGSIMDLTSGQLRPAPLSRSGNRFTLRYPDCPARTLLRIHWPLPEHRDGI
jgi:predicted phosphodiesterase